MMAPRLLGTLTVRVRLVTLREVTTSVVFILTVDCQGRSSAESSPFPSEEPHVEPRRAERYVVDLVIVFSGECL